MRSNHIGPVEAVRVFRMLGANDALAIHWGTFQLSYEGIDDPPRLLRAALASTGIDPGRFRALEAGQSWDVPPLGQANSPSEATSSSLRTRPKLSASVAR
jgi:L-ascorbate metabolism protein UlaG (beta-lactamase superfamily)